jgi:hypothetical protein
MAFRGRTKRPREGKTPPDPTPAPSVLVGPFGCLRCPRGMTFQGDRICTACRRSEEIVRVPVDEVSR